MSPGKGKNDKIFHPQSRKAGQVERTQLRKSKIEGAAAKRARRASSTIDIYVFFYHALPPDEDALTLEGLHELIKDVWLTRHDIELEEERKLRRKGRAKSTKEINLENLKLYESEGYRTGIEIPDLTHPKNVELFRRWDQKAIEYIDILRFIRINSESPSTVIVSRPGKHESLRLAAAEQMAIDA
ncbi:translation machinery-associated protein 16 [Phellopilus nigrolimitatus]|nr:translation machinery-associated protein 16 [Phellopilus nigrolimitatus]